jgi:hypothetical protein
MQLAETNKSHGPSVFFGGHETFPFRYGWLKKCVDAVTRDETFFLQKRAMIELGVGKKMVDSIRYWGQASRVISERAGPGAKRGRFVPTEVGRLLFGESGCDPYMEDPATLWLLHWLVASNSIKATMWFWMFSVWNNLEFNKERVTTEIQSWLSIHGYRSVSENSLKRDVDCFVRTYTRSRQAKQVILEDSLDCPLVDLHLISEFNDSRSYQFQRGIHASLPDEVFAFALIEFWISTTKSNTLALARIEYDPGSPGRIFKLDEDSLIFRLDRLETLTSGALYYDETSGLKQVSRRSEITPLELLSSYYSPRLAKSTSPK